VHDELLLAIDAGTTSTRVLAFDLAGRVRAQAGAPFGQHFPQPGWVEHDALEIRDRTLACLAAVLAELGTDASRVRAVGITNQRETIAVWDRVTGMPIAPAIVWQDRRTAARCRALAEAGHEAEVQRLTGLVLDPYFSATKLAWLLDAIPEARAAARAGRLAAGTIESWLFWHLTGGQHLSDATNASRTALMRLDGGWDDGLCDLFDVPRPVLPEIVDTAGTFGHIQADLPGGGLPICGLIGDQQAAAAGQGCFTPGMVKATYGTGAFMLLATGAVAVPSRSRLLTTVAAQIAGKRSYALEGSIFVAGSAVQWLRDGLGLIGTSGEIEALAASVPDSGGVVFVPALTGLGAPHWRPEARGLITGLTRGSSRAHIARACLEAAGHQTADLFEAFARDGCRPETLRVDGGMAANRLFLQDLSDLLDIIVERPEMLETTALGAAIMAGLGCGLLDVATAAQSMRTVDSVHYPAITEASRRVRRAVWHDAVGQVMAGGRSIAAQTEDL